MAPSTEATLLHHVDRARAPHYALDLAARMVVSSRTSRDLVAVRRWARRHAALSEPSPQA